MKARIMKIATRMLGDEFSATVLISSYYPPISKYIGKYQTIKCKCNPRQVLNKSFCTNKLNHLYRSSQSSPTQIVKPGEKRERNPFLATPPNEQSCTENRGEGIGKEGPYQPIRGGSCSLFQFFFLLMCFLLRCFLLLLPLTKPPQSSIEAK